MSVYRRLTLSGRVYLKFWGTHSEYISKSEYLEGLAKESSDKKELKNKLKELRES